MLDTSAAALQNLIIHRVGNNAREEGYHLSGNPVAASEGIGSLLLKSYLGETTRKDEMFEFFHESDLSLHPMHVFSSELFADPEQFQSVSEKIAKHLYSVSTHPNIAGGDLFILLIDNIIKDGHEYRAVGVFKTEIKDKFLSVHEDNGSFTLLESEGINPNVIQKGAIILSDDGGVFAIDRLSNKTKYWLDAFLKVRPRTSEKKIISSISKVYKKVAEELDSPEQAIKYNDELISLVSSQENVSIQDLNALAEAYVAPERITELFDEHLEEDNLEELQALKVETRSLAPRIKRQAKKIKLVSGADLMLSSGVSIKNVTQSKMDNLTEITIVIERAADE